ncbi:hypothetical protein MLD38_017573 [Melastoma candidum]|uniref:Uncharacterized protein n=1 Tax=Melastoma candidum TaxID=119954 RepID=A0ACB9QSZ4_9MYRT|nr:hypothetical protein MLD38_017573 [Melastoma candidum]
MHQPQNGEEWEVPMAKEAKQEEGEGGAEFTSMDVAINCTAVEEYIEFCPVEHPLEPLDDDRPVKCPMANSSANNGQWRMIQERVSPSIRRISRVEDMKKKLANPSNSVANHLVRKRHYSITDGDIILTPVRIAPPRPSDSTVLFRMCQGIDRFNTKSTSQL